MEPLEPGVDATQPRLGVIPSVVDGSGRSLPEDAFVGNAKLHGRAPRNATAAATADVDALGPAVTGCPGPTTTASNPDTVRNIRSRDLSATSPLSVHDIGQFAERPTLRGQQPTAIQEPPPRRPSVDPQRRLALERYVFGRVSIRPTLRRWCQQRLERNQPTVATSAPARVRNTLARSLLGAVLGPTQRATSERLLPAFAVVDNNRGRAIRVKCFVQFERQR